MSQKLGLKSLHRSHTAEGWFIIESMTLSRPQCFFPTFLIRIHFIPINLIIRGHGIRQQCGIALEDTVNTHKGIDVITIGACPPHLSTFLHGKAKEQLEALAHQGASYIENKIGHIIPVISHIIQHFIEIGNQEIAGKFPACRILA